MKKFLMLITAMLCIFCGTLAFAACGESVNSGNTGNGGTQTEQSGSGSQDDEQSGTEGLQYQKRKDADGGEYAAVVGLGTAWETDIVIPSVYRDLPVKEIGEAAFSARTDTRNATLTSISIPDSVTSIGSDAFWGCSGLTSVTIGNGVTSIGDSAFYNCSGLQEVHISDLSAWCEITFSDSSSNPLCYGAKLYLGDNPVTELKDLTDITEIKAYAFNSYKSLTSVIIPSSVTSIRDWAFYNCSGLTSVTIGSGVTSIGNMAFDGCSGLESIEVAQGNSIYHSAGNCLIRTDDKVLILGCKTSKIPDDDSVTSIGRKAFGGYSGLTSVTIPESVTSIGDYAFSGCSGLTSVTIGSGVTSIGSEAFDGCSGLQEVHISDLSAWCEITFSDFFSNPLYYGAKLYLGDTPVTELKDLTDITEIKAYAFNSYKSLTSVIIPSSVTSIGRKAFEGCSGLTSVTIGSGVTSIGDYAFAYCSGLTSITIPDSVTEIGHDAFSGCSALKSVIFRDPNGWSCGSTKMDATFLQDSMPQEAAII